MLSIITPSKKSSEQGFTLLESLMGIVVIGLVLAVMGPPLLFVAGTRIQHQRAEQAMQLAQSQVDQVRLLMVQGQNQPLNLPCVTSDSISSTAAPTILTANAVAASTTATCTNGGVWSDIQKIVSVNSDNFLVQVFRDQGVADTSGNLIAFRMGVRVYGPQVFTSSNFGKTLQTQSTSLTFTTFPSTQKPMAVLFTEVSKNDLGISLAKYKTLLDPNENNASQN